MNTYENAAVVGFHPTPADLTAHYADGVTTPVVGFLTLAVPVADEHVTTPGGYPAAWSPYLHDGDTATVIVVAVSDETGRVRPATHFAGFTGVKVTEYPDAEK